MLDCWEWDRHLPVPGVSDPELHEILADSCDASRSQGKMVSELSVLVIDDEAYDLDARAQRLDENSYGQTVDIFGVVRVMPVFVLNRI